MENKKSGYMFNVGDIVKVERNDYQEMVFYKIQVVKESQTGREVIGYKNIRFADPTTNIPSGTRIKLLDIEEDFYQKDKYTTIFTLKINDYENLGEEMFNEVDQISALEDYNNQIGDFNF
jgi:hypothetical protein